MHSYCTVCGVKLTAKNRISYRPNSCRDCELERKRLYSLKRKKDSPSKSKSTAKKATTKSAAKKTSKKTTTKKTAKKTASKKSTLTKAQVQKERERARKEKERERARKEKEKEKARKEKEKARARKEKEREKARKEKEREKARKEKEREKALKIKEKEKLQKQKEREKLRKEREKEKELARKEKEKLRELKRQEREAEKERKREEREAERERKRFEKEEAKRLKQEEKERKAREKAEKERAERERKKLIDANMIVDLPDYVFEQSTAKVKKRRLSNSRAAKKEQIIDAELGNNKTSPESSQASTPFNPSEVFDGEVLRAPSDTPWEGNNFKIVGGSFVNHSGDDTEESRGPTEDEVKAIIERIRLEHQSKKEAPAKDSAAKDKSDTSKN